MRDFEIQNNRKKNNISKKINEEFLRYDDKWKNYLTLMGCYPIWTDKDRIIVVWEIVE